MKQLRYLLNKLGSCGRSPDRVTAGTVRRPARASLPRFIEMIPIEFRWHHKNGTVRWGEAHVSRIPREGQRTSLQVILLDITDRKETERESKERQTYLESVLASTPNAIVTLDAEQRVVEWNPGAEKLFGYSPEEAIGRVLDNLVACDKFFDEATRWTKVMLRGKTIEARETVRFRKDGSPVSVIVAGSPIVVDEKLIGTVVLYTDITERKQAEEALEQRAAQLATINRIGQQVTAILDQQALLQQAVDAVQDNLGYCRAAILLLDETTHELYVAVATDNFWKVIPDGHRQPVGKGAIGIAAETRETVLVHDAANDPRVFTVGDWQPSSSLSVPIQTSEWMIGILEVESDEVEAYDDEDVTVMNILADQIATAIENARLYQETHQRMLEQETLRESALALTTTLDRDEVIERILAQLQMVVPYDTASVQLFRGEMLEIVGGRGFPNLEKLLGVKFDPQQTDNPNREVIRTQSSFIVEDTPAHYEEFKHGPHAAAGIRSWLGAPMLIGERIIGMIALDKREHGFYTPAHARLAEAFAAQAAIAVENSRLFQAEREQRALTQALEGAAAAVSSTLDLELVLDRILEQVERVVAGDAFNVMLIEGQTVRVVRHRGYDPLGLAAHIADLSTPIAEIPTLQKMQRTGKPLIISDVTVDPDWVTLENTRWVHAYVAAPIHMRGETLGFLNVDGSRPNQFTSEDAQRLRAFADHAAAAIENAKLYQKMLDYADHLEQRVQQRTAELQSQYARSDAILRNTTDGIVVTDVSGKIVQTNPVAHAWLHHTLLPEDANRLEETIRELAQQAEAFPEKVLALKGLDLALAAAPILAESRKDALGVVIDIHDVSHLKALDRMKTHFVTNVSHELRTPVTSIKLYAHLMRQQPENWQEHLDMLAREADHQARLVEDILQISRIDAGRLEMDTRPISLTKLVNDVIDGHQALALDRGLALQRQLSKSIPKVVADPARVRQVLNNLIENAIHYTPPGGQILVRTDTEESEERTWATVTVSDTGIGIPEEEIPQIFDRFFRGGEPRDMQLSGTGLGLAIVKEIVELHGGRVTVESQIGQGSAFSVRLPIAERPS
ncbi:MAG TPA: GAF domain-containing protein [Chloroflexi bacterium]|nr:GAF domain-containing protein [Chloroflexota bacterium]